MDPLERTPTEAADYAAISALYGALLAGTAASARGRAPIPTAELPALAAASFALSKLLVKEKAESWVRRPFVDESGPTAAAPRAADCASPSANCSTCTRCVGAWSALGLVALRLHAPGPARTVTAVLAASAGNDMLQTTFTWLCAHATAEQKIAENPATARVARSRYDGAHGAVATCHAANRKNPAPATVRCTDRRGYQNA